MDKRIEKTRDAIYEAFTKTLMQKTYAKITIEDILTEAKVSRSTFYAHFRTKEELLNSILNHIFSHVFSHTLTEEKTHDFSKSSIFDYTHFITHIFYHLHDEERLIKAILASESKSIFLENIKKHLEPIASMIVNNTSLKSKNIPLELVHSLTIEAFILTLEYWFSHDCIETPEAITKYYFSMIL